MRHRLTERSLGIWHGAVPGIEPGQRYGFRVAGPWSPEAGLRFNPQKLLLDPYARAISGELSYDPAIYGFRDDPAARDFEDSAAHVPLSVVVDDRFDWGDDEPPRRRWRDSVIYELHVKGMTQLHDRVPPSCAGPTPGWPRRRSSTTCATWASPRSSCCPSTTSSPSRPWPRAGS